MSEHGVAGFEPSETGLHWICACGRRGKGSTTYAAAKAALMRHLKTQQEATSDR